MSIKTIGDLYCVNGKHLNDLYKNKLSGFHDWRRTLLSHGYYVNVDNIGPHMSLDETGLSGDQVYTILTNKDGHGGKGTLAAIIPGTKSDVIIDSMLQTIPRAVRVRVKEITTDLSPSMHYIANETFPCAELVADRFHVQQLFNDAMNDLRLEIRRQSLDEENSLREKAEKDGVHFEMQRYENGETMRLILRRSKHVLMRDQSQWSIEQKARINILFREHKVLSDAYDLMAELRTIYNRKHGKYKAGIELARWFDKVKGLGRKAFNTVCRTMKNYIGPITNYFNRRATNASAESFNSKIKLFRSQMRGVRDNAFFIFRLAMLFA